MQKKPERVAKKEPEKKSESEIGSEITAEIENATYGTPRADLPDAPAENNLLELQRTRGNLYVRRMLADGLIQRRPHLSSAGVLQLQRTHGNAYVRHILNPVVQREVNKAALDKIAAYATDVPGMPTNYPGVFTELNALSFEDMRDTLLHLASTWDLDRILEHMSEAVGDLLKLRNGFIAAILDKADPQKPSDTAIGRLVKLLQTTRDGLPATIATLPEAQSKYILMSVPSLAQSGSVSGTYKENVGGVEYVGTTGYDYQLEPEQIKVTVKFNFTGVQNSAVFQNWISRIKRDWNTFKAVNKANPKQALNIEFDPQIAGSGAHHTVTVVNGAGRANEHTWYLGKTPGDDESMRMAAHEFGHTIGLKDEYQLNHDDYVKTVGEEPGKRQEFGTGDSEEIAKEIHDALSLPLTATFTSDDRADKVLGVVKKYSLAQGRFARIVAKRYQEAYTVDIIADIVAKVPAVKQYDIVDPFTYSSDSMMGVQSDHIHPVHPRHVRDFATIIEKARGGTWEPQPR